MSDKPKKPTKGVVILRKSWVNEAGVGDYVQPKTPHPQQDIVAIYAVPVTKFDLADGWFLEIEFYPEMLRGRPIKLFVPKQEVVAVLQGDRPEDLMGFKN